MRLLETIEQEVYDNGIILIDSPFMKKESITIQWNGIIAMFVKPSGHEIKKRVIRLSHELEHYYTHTYYDDETRDTLIDKYEYQANSRAVARLLPPDDIKKAVFKGCCISVGDIADYVDMPYDFVDMALHIYQRQGELPYKHELPEEYFDMCADEC